MEMEAMVDTLDISDYGWSENGEICQTDDEIYPQELNCIYKPSVEDEDENDDEEEFTYDLESDNDTDDEDEWYWEKLEVITVYDY